VKNFAPPAALEAGPESQFFAERREKSPKSGVKLVTEVLFDLCTGILESRFFEGKYRRTFRLGL